MLKLKLQYFGHLMRRADSLENTLMLGKIQGRKRRGQQRIRWLDGITNSMDMGLWTLGVGDGQGGLACCGSWSRKESDMTEQLNWTELNWEIAKDRIAWHAALHGIAMSRTRLSDWTTTTTTKYVGVPNITLRFSIFYIYFFILSIYPFFSFIALIFVTTMLVLFLLEPVNIAGVSRVFFFKDKYSLI